MRIGLRPGEDGFDPADQELALETFFPLDDSTMQALLSRAELELNARSGDSPEGLLQAQT